MQDATPDRKQSHLLERFCLSKLNETILSDFKGMKKLPA